MHPSILRTKTNPGQMPYWFTSIAVACLVSAVATAAPVPAAPNFSLSSSSSSLTLLVGGSTASATIGVSGQNGFSGNVSMAVSGLPHGVTATFSSVSTISRSVVTLAPSAAAVPGNYTVTVTGISGTLTRSKAIALSIPAPSFGLSSTASALTLGVGYNKPVEIAVTNPLNLVNKVSLAASGVPQGVTAAFATVNASTTSLTFTLASMAPPGIYAVTVKGTSGTASSTATIELTILPESFTLSPSLGSMTLLVGGSSATSSIGVTGQNGFSGSVTFAASGVPSGVTATFSSASSQWKSALTLTPGATAVPGNYTVKVTGTSGTLTGSTTIAVTIPVPSFSLSSSSSSLTLLVGGSSASTTIGVVNPIGLSNGNVNLALSGLPAGVTSRLNWPSATSTSPIALTVTASASATPGTYPLTVTGTSGTAQNSTIVVLTIPVPSFSLSASASALTLLVSQNGWNLPIDISVINPIGLANKVSLAVSQVPTGITSAFTGVNASTLALTFKASSTAAPGIYPVTVRGTSGAASSTTVITVTVLAPGFTLSSSTSSLTLPVGGSSATSSISVAGQSGFNSNVTLSASGIPSGVTAAFSPASTSTRSSLTLKSDTTAVPGAYTINVIGASGTLTSSTTIALTIPVPSFTLSPSLSTLTLLTGGTANTTIGVSGLSASSSPVALTAAGLPAGVTPTFSPATTSTTSTLAFAASTTTVPGTYTVTVKGTSGTATNATAVALTIQKPVSTGPISVAITQPAYGFNVLPGSVRRIYATVTNGVTNGVNWSATGGATLSSTTGNWVDVTAPATGSSCSINGTENFTIGSATQFMLTAQSQESTSQTASIVVNVCNPAVQVQVVPFYTTVYSEQKADVQAFVWGSSNRNVTWAITAQPNGGDGALTDAANQDTVFSANVAGRYTLTATSVADGSKTNTATVYVTGHYMPYQVTPSETMPVDCTVDPALTGATYEVGPSQAYKTIQSVPWSSLQPGSTVRIHNEDTTGGSPTTYHEYFQLAAHATRTQPVRVCGVPDSRGNLPVIDASSSTGSSTVSSYSAGYTAVGIGTTGWAGVYKGTWTGSQYLIVEGLKIQNAKPPFTYTTPAGAAGTAWIGFSACIRLFPSLDTVVRGIDAYNCGLGFFSDFNANNGYAAVANTLYEGNHLHDNGISGSYGEHQFYIQGWNEVVQFNVVDQYQTGAEGSNFKGRGFPEIVRYNHFGDGAARQLDMVDNQDGGSYTSFEGYLEGGTNSARSLYPSDAYTADLLAAAVEAHHADYVYGNTFLNTKADVPIHYFGDMGTSDNNRLGTLWFYNNSFYERTNTYWRWFLFDTSGGGGDDDPAIEWPQIQVLNNAIWTDSPTKPYFYWNLETNEFTTFGNNVINSNWGTGAMAGGDGTGWASKTSSFAFQGATNSADTWGVSNLIGVTADPFDVTTFEPNPSLVDAGASLPANGPKLPVRFQYGPSAIQTVRNQPLTVGAME